MSTAQPSSLTSPGFAAKARRGVLLLRVQADRTSVEGTFAWVGVTRRGQDVSIIDWQVNGQDATYPVDPTRAALRTTNGALAALG